MLLNLDGPQSLDALGLGVVAALVFVLVGLGYPECKQRKRQQLETVLCCYAVMDFWEKRILSPCLLVCG